MRRLRLALFAVVLSTSTAAPTLAQCQEWSAGFAVPGVDSVVYASAVFDDGSGPALYVGGLFDYAESVPAQGIARWNGAEWSNVGGGVDGNVFALMVFDDGSGPALYVGGYFDTAGGAPAANLVRWDGTSWSEVGGGVAASGWRGVQALESFDDGGGPALYATGEFDSAGGVPALGIARWNGTVWSALGSGLTWTQVGNGIPHGKALKVFGNELYVGGSFGELGTLASSAIARWDGSAWHDVGGSFSSALQDVEALEVWNDGSGDRLYVGGDLWKVGGFSIDDLAAWDGTQWTNVGGGLGGGSGDNVYALAVHKYGGGTALYVGGDFNTFGIGRNITRWNGTAWTQLATGTASRVYSLGVYDDGGGAALIAGGSFNHADEAAANNIAEWRAGAWSGLGDDDGAEDEIHAFATFDDGNGPALFVSGEFISIGSARSHGIARWDGSTYSDLDGGVDYSFNFDVRAMAVYDDGGGEDLYVGGDFFGIGGLIVQHIARWDGASWSTLPGMNDEVNALAVFDDGSGPALYAGGQFIMAGATPAKRIAKWDGTSWSALGGGMTTATTEVQVDALAVFDDGGGPALYAAGAFRFAGGVAADRIARWDGTSWTAPGALQLSSRARALAVFDGALYVGGNLNDAGGLPADKIARWDGAAWSTVGAGLDKVVYALYTHDDGNGAALYAGGAFRASGATPLDYAARWDGSTWSALGAGVDDEVRALGHFADGRSGGPPLYVGGLFEYADGRPAAYIARWSEECPCIATYCTSGTTASGCNATIAGTGTPSASSGSGFDVTVTGSEGQKDGLLYFGTAGAQANTWGNGTSFQCVVPPVVRTGVQSGAGAAGSCAGSFQLDFNTWMATHRLRAPAAGEKVRMQAWFRDPASTSNQSTSLSNGLSFIVCP
jgi:hypothetical protein